MGVTFLTSLQNLGDDRAKGQLQVMKAYGTKAGMSDLAIVLGGHMGAHTTSDGQRAGAVWSASHYGRGYFIGINSEGTPGCHLPNERQLGARPALSNGATLEALMKNEAKYTRKIAGVDVIEYGEYPQTIAPGDIADELEKAFLLNKANATGKIYHFDSKKRNTPKSPFKAKEFAEYEHKDKRYIRVEAKPYDHESVLSNGHTPKAGEACWIEVQPIEWLKEPGDGMVARQALFAGVQLDNNTHYSRNFADTDMYRYLQNYFAKEMLPQQQMGQDAGAGHAQAERNRKKEALRPIINAAFDALSLNELDARQRETALDAAVDAQLKGRARG